jgi:hypothetical protein
MQYVSVQTPVANTVVQGKATSIPLAIFSDRMGIHGIADNLYYFHPTFVLRDSDRAAATPGI